MFWDKVASLYDFFEMLYNGKVYNGIGAKVAEELSPDDIVLECACGTGAISKHIAPNCRFLIATDMSKGMLKQAYRKCNRYGNVKIKYADMTHLKCRSNRFDKVVAGNVIHLLDDPVPAVNELVRVCKSGGKIIIPTYINAAGTEKRKAVKLLEKMGVDFKREFNIKTYKQFFQDAGYENVRYYIVDGRMPCAIAVITKQ